MDLEAVNQATHRNPRMDNRNGADNQNPPEPKDRRVFYILRVDH